MKQCDIDHFLGDPACLRRQTISHQMVSTMGSKVMTDVQSECMNVYFNTDPDQFEKFSMN